MKYVESFNPKNGKIYRVSLADDIPEHLKEEVIMETGKYIAGKIKSDNRSKSIYEQARSNRTL